MIDITNLTNLELTLLLRGIAILNHSTLTTEEKNETIRLRSDMKNEIRKRGIPIRGE